jgi:hypothetical protein
MQRPSTLQEILHRQVREQVFEPNQCARSLPSLGGDIMVDRTIKPAKRQRERDTEPATFINLREPQRML